MSDRIGVALESVRRRGARVVVSFIATVSAALLAVIPVLLIAGASPLAAGRALINGSLAGKSPLAETLVSACPLLLAGLAVALAFQAGLFNIGVEGQLVIGGLTAGAIGAKLSLPTGVHLFVALAGGATAGALWALVPGLLKAFRGVHEVITTIMLNYIAFSVSLFLVSPGGWLVAKTQPSATEKVKPTAELTRIWGDTRLHSGIIVAIVMVAFLWYFLYRSPAGYRFRMVGANARAAAFNGIRTPVVTVQALCMSGALAGLAGAVEVLGVHRRYFDSFSPGYGFDSIAVALLGMLNPIGVAASALFFGMLRAGSGRLQIDAGVSRDMITVVSGLVVAFVAGRAALEQVLTDRRRRAEAALVQARAEATLTAAAQLHALAAAHSTDAAAATEPAEP